MEDRQVVSVFASPTLYSSKPASKTAEDTSSLLKGGDDAAVEDEDAIKDDDSGANCNAGGDSTASDGASDAAFDAGSNAASDEGASDAPKRHEPGPTPKRHEPGPTSTHNPPKPQELGVNGGRDMGALHPNARDVVSGGFSIKEAKLLKNASKSETMKTVVALLVARTAYVLEQMAARSEPGSVFVLGAPDGTPKTEGTSRLDPLLAAAVAVLEIKGVTHMKAGFTRNEKLKTPAKSRPNLDNEAEAEDAAKEEAETVGLGLDLESRLSSGEACTVIIVDDIAATGITLFALQLSIIKKCYPNVTVLLLALHTTQSLAGVAAGTLLPEESREAMGVKCKEVYKDLENLNFSSSKVGGCIYVRELSVTWSDIDAVVAGVEDDSTASGWEKRWARAMKVLHGAKGARASTPPPVRYVGQVHAPEKTAQQRWNEEDSGNDGTGLYNQVRVRVAKARKAKLSEVNYTSRVVVDSAGIHELAVDGKTDFLSAMDYAEEAFYMLLKSSYKEGGANCIKPGPMCWQPMVFRLRKMVGALFRYMLSSGCDEWVVSDEGRAAKTLIWNLPTATVCADDDRILAFICHQYGDSTPTARDLERDLCSYAGAIGGANGVAISNLVEEARAKDPDDTSVTITWKGESTIVPSSFPTLGQRGAIGVALSNLVEEARAKDPDDTSVTITWKGESTIVPSSFPTLGQRGTKGGQKSTPAKAEAAVVAHANRRAAESGPGQTIHLQTLKQIDGNGREGGVLVATGDNVRRYAKKETALPTYLLWETLPSENKLPGQVLICNISNKKETKSVSCALYVVVDRANN